MSTPLPPVTALVQLPALRALKRPRSTSEDSMSIERILKAHKRSPCDSPRSMSSVAEATTTTAESAASSPTPRSDNEWPKITTTETVKHAIAFLRDSRHHALVLLTQNQWQRALSVLDKVERANDIIARQRRKVVLEQANATHTSSPQKTPCASERSGRKSVRFSEEVQVATAIDADRAPAKIPAFVREEIYILRASRAIPSENYSEFWN